MIEREKKEAKRHKYVGYGSVKKLPPGNATSSHLKEIYVAEDKGSHHSIARVMVFSCIIGPRTIYRRNETLHSDTRGLHLLAVRNFCCG